MARGDASVKEYRIGCSYISKIRLVEESTVEAIGDGLLKIAGNQLFRHSQRTL